MKHLSCAFLFLSYYLQHFFQEQCSTLHWQDSRDPLQQVGGDMYAQPTSVPIGMESNMQHSPVFHHPNHGMGEPSINHGQHVFGGGMMQYETVSQQQGMFHEALPPQQHYHPPPSAVSPGNHHPPPPVMVSRNIFSSMWANNQSCISELLDNFVVCLYSNTEFQYYKII